MIIDLYYALVWVELADGDTGSSRLFSTDGFPWSRLYLVASMEKGLPVFRQHILSSLHDTLCSHMDLRKLFYK